MSGYFSNVAFEKTPIAEKPKVAQACDTRAVLTVVIGSRGALPRATQRSLKILGIFTHSRYYAVFWVYPEGEIVRAIAIRVAV